MILKKFLEQKGLKFETLKKKLKLKFYGIDWFI